jgi:hypothetical protein
MPWFSKKILLWKNDFFYVRESGGMGVAKVHVVQSKVRTRKIQKQPDWRENR